jgi:hypothetical protein
LKTSGYGGAQMRKGIIVKTNDPSQQKINLIVRGPVEKVLDIMPQRVNLVGVPGQTLTEVVTITPSEKYPFSILSIEQLPNSGVMATLVEPSPENRSWQIKVSATAPQVVNLYDNLKVSIRVSVYFVEQKKDTNG